MRIVKKTNYIKQPTIIFLSIPPVPIPFNNSQYLGQLILKKQKTEIPKGHHDQVSLVERVAKGITTIRNQPSYSNR